MMGGPGGGGGGGASVADAEPTGGAASKAKSVRMAVDDKGTTGVFRCSRQHADVMTRLVWRLLSVRGWTGWSCRRPEAQFNPTC